MVVTRRARSCTDWTPAGRHARGMTRGVCRDCRYSRWRRAAGASGSSAHRSSRTCSVYVGVSESAHMLVSYLSRPTVCAGAPVRLGPARSERSPDAALARRPLGARAGGSRVRRPDHSKPRTTPCRTRAATHLQKFSNAHPWNEEAIMDRGVELVVVASQVWPYPGQPTIGKQ